MSEAWTPRVVVVEDSETQALRLRLLLEQEGFQVAVAGTAEDALAGIAEQRPDLLVADYHLPGMQGDELCRRLREKLDTRSLPVLMLTEDENREVEQHLLDSGADDYIVKSTDPEIILARVYSLLHKTRRSDDLLDLLDTSFQQAHLLVVDDSATFREVLAYELEQEGYTVETASGGQEALERMTGARFDCVLVDLVMPGMDGTELCAQLARRRELSQEAFVYIMLTASERKDDVVKALQAGADDFVGKSSDTAVLKSRIRALLRRKFFHEEARRILDRLKAQELETLRARAEADAARQRAALVDELEHANRELVAAREAADAANRSKSEFLANMSHELRTPLNAVIGYAELVGEELEEQGDHELRVDVMKIRAAGNHLLALINDVLDLSKIEAGRVELEVLPVTVPELVSDVAATIGPLAGANGNVFEVDCPEDVGTMQSDPTRVRQILFNLLSNASKFTRNGRIELTVRRETGERGEVVTFTVSDTGIGISAEHVGRVFEAFTQADASTTRQHGGTGLGLTITRHYCQMLGGSIEVDSVLGEGAAFTVRLPVQPRRHQEHVDAPPAPVPDGADVEPGPRLRELVLVVDDDPYAVEVLERHLVRLGCDVVSAGGGEACLRLAAEVKPDLIMLDLVMPDLDGWAVLERLKSDPVTANTPVILCTLTPDREKGHALGAADVITKPVNRDALAAAVSRFNPTDRTGRALVVEDDAASRETMVRTLRRQGWRVAEAVNGAEALEAIAAMPPDVVLLDLMMPVMHGFEFLDRLQATEAGRNVPVIVVTAMTLDAQARARLQGQVLRVLQKGEHGLETLMEEVTSVIRRERRSGLDRRAGRERRSDRQ